MLRHCNPTDVAQICDIYNYYVRESVITFEESPVLEVDMARRIADVTLRLPWLVWDVDGSILGYAYATLNRP
jgi:L-amino acid N-acyltransferase YncA